MKKIPTIHTVDRAIEILKEGKYSKGKDVSGEIQKLLNLREALATATIDYKDPRQADKIGLMLDPNDSSTKAAIKKDPGIQKASIGNTQIKESKDSYTPEESQAVGEAFKKPLVASIRSSKGELKEEPRVTGGTNKFEVHLEYGHQRGEDNFTFHLNPSLGNIQFKQGSELVDLVKFEITEANQVRFDPSVDLKQELENLLKKKSITTPGIEDINRFINERKKAVNESFSKNSTTGDYIKDFRKSDAPQFKGKSQEKRTQMAVAASLNSKNENCVTIIQTSGSKDKLKELIKDLAQLYRTWDETAPKEGIEELLSTAMGCISQVKELQRVETPSY